MLETKRVQFFLTHSVETKHQKVTENIRKHYQLIAVSYSYRHQSSFITYMAKLQQSVTQSAQKRDFSSKFQVKKFH